MRILRGKEEALRCFRGRGDAPVDDEAARTVEGIVADVRRRGDAALREWTERLDGARLERFAAPPEAFEAAEAALPEALRTAIRLAVGRVRAYHERQPRGGFLEADEGGLLGQLVRPLDRVACYVPGGQAPLFSSLIMLAVPARVAGVPDVVVATPPRRDGSVAPEILWTARELGIDAVYRVGGAQAVAALAYGTEQLPRVDKVVGPGNRWVMLAKRQVFGAVGIESLPGPTETLVLADGRASPAHVVADLLAQAEHEGAQPVLVTDSEALLEAVAAGLEPALATLPTADAARASLAERGALVLVDDLAEGVEVANAYAPEHLCLLVEEPWALVPLVRHAGGLFLGAHSLEALGDYLAGPSHVMPTGGTARFASAVNVRDFQKVIPLLEVREGLLREIGPAAATMARAEGLEAHARAIEARLPNDGR